MPLNAPPEPELPPEVQRMLARQQSTEAMVHGAPRGESRIGLVIKRTFFGDADGRWEPASEDDEELIRFEAMSWFMCDPPYVAPVALDNDTAAFREATDLVVQGHAQTYGVPRGDMTVGVRVGGFHRQIHAFGDRTIDWSGDGPRFSAPEPFDVMPIRYDYAYGGFDADALERWVDPSFERMDRVRPEWRLRAATPLHYARNPAGRGFLISLDEKSAGSVKVPNLEFPNDPLSPERLAVGSPDNWPAGPLPACMDWTSLDWFPRKAYLGGMKRPAGFEGPFAEIELGWAAPDLFEIPSVLKSGVVRPELAQAASPGMSFEELPLHEPFELTNLHPEQPRWTCRVPQEVPVVQLDLGGPSLTTLETRLNALVIRPDLDQLVMVWCAQAPVSRRYSPDQAAEIRREIAWRRPE